MKTLIHYMPSKTNTHYTIPKTVEWIGKHSFYKCKNLRQVILTENVSFVGNNVFSDCDNITLINNSPHFTYKNGLLYNADMTQVYHYSMGSNIKHVVIEEGTRTIGRNAFWNSKQIESITIPSTVRQIGYNPFANCINAKFINNSLHYQLLDGIIYSKDLKELVCCTDKVARSGFDLPKALVSIGRNAFVGCKSLEQISLPENVKYISRGAFSGCVNLHSVKLSENITAIGDWAFNNCVSLKNICIPKNIKIHPNTFNNTQTRVTII
ncbi:MAG: leucine-rich repeat domain-containing protein [Bacillota bacterium]